MQGCKTIPRAVMPGYPMEKARVYQPLHGGMHLLEFPLISPEPSLVVSASEVAL